MSVVQPKLLQVLRDDIDRVGIEAANVLALIRYVTNFDGERNGRVEIGGEIWPATTT